MAEFSLDQAEFDRAWSMAAGESAAMDMAYRLAMEESARFFMARDDKTASVLRDFASKLLVISNDCATEVRKFIAEDARRAS